MRPLITILVALSTAACASSSLVPDDAPHAFELQSFEATTIERQGGSAYRMLLHEWHKTPAFLQIGCINAECQLEFRLTDGYGTYHQGELEQVVTARISENEFRELAVRLEARGIWRLPDHRDDLRTGVDEDGEEVIYLCLHAPSYFLDARDGDRGITIYRTCEENYMDGYIAAAPLLEIFLLRFPDEFARASHLSSEEVQDLLAEGSTQQ